MWSTENESNWQIEIKILLFYIFIYTPILHTLYIYIYTYVICIFKVGLCTLYELRI